MFDLVDREAMFQSLQHIGSLDVLITTTMHLYESFLGRLTGVYGASNFMKSVVGVKYGCSLSPTLFGHVPSSIGFDLCHMVQVRIRVRQ